MTPELAALPRLLAIVGIATVGCLFALVAGVLVVVVMRWMGADRPELLDRPRRPMARKVTR